MKFVHQIFIVYNRGVALYILPKLRDFLLGNNFFLDLYLSLKGSSEIGEKSLNFVRRIFMQFTLFSTLSE